LEVVAVVEEEVVALSRRRWLSLMERRGGG
jgi:hypothetical protein